MIQQILHQARNITQSNSHILFRLPRSFWKTRRIRSKRTTCECITVSNPCSHWEAKVNTAKCTANKIRSQRRKRWIKYIFASMKNSGIRWYIRPRKSWTWSNWILAGKTWKRMRRRRAQSPLKIAREVLALHIDWKGLFQGNSKVIVYDYQRIDDVENDPK